MRKAISLAIVSCIFLILSCGQSGLVKNDNQNKNNNVKNGTKSENGFSFEQEGFISKDHFRVLVIRPFDSTISDGEIEKQVRNKCIVSLKRHITSGGKTLSANADAEILNLINDYGKITAHDDEGGSRTVFVLDIRKSGCRQQIEKLGR